MGIIWSQLFPPSPTFTEKDLPSLKGKVYMVTGGSSGVGLELASMLYHAGGKVYITGRSRQNAEAAIASITASSTSPSTPGHLEYLPMDLSDLRTIKPAAQAFLAKEPKLDVLWNNAGMSIANAGSVSTQGHELIMATNCFGPHLLTQLLLPALRAVADRSDGADVARVVWTSSIMVDICSPVGGNDLELMMKPWDDHSWNYNYSKMGNWYLASELGREEERVVSVTQNPGNLKTNIMREAPGWAFVVAPLLYKARMGAYTELYAGLSPDVTVRSNGGYIVPWGRFHPAPSDKFLKALRSKQEGGTGQAEMFRAWCDKQIEAYL